MPFSPPEVGMVVNYSYLWARERKKGQDDGLKNRPCVVLAVDPGPQPIAYVAPVTHCPPDYAVRGLQIPPETKQRLKLDKKPSWIICSEVNVFPWPGADLNALGQGRTAYGILPPAMHAEIMRRVKHFAETKDFEVVKREPAKHGGPR